MVYPGFAGNAQDAERVDRAFRLADVDLTVMYHATYIDDGMSVSFLRETGNIFTVLFFSQGLPGLEGQHSP